MPTMMPSFYFEQMVPSISSSSSSSSCSSPAASVSVEKATSYLLIDPDWTLNMEICDSINSSDRYCAHNSQFFFFFFLDVLWSWPLVSLHCWETLGLLFHVWWMLVLCRGVWEPPWRIIHSALLDLLAFGRNLRMQNLLLSLFSNCVSDSPLIGPLFQKDCLVRETIT